MSFNDALNFTPTTESLQQLDCSFHILLSSYLRESKTFELYDAIFKAKRTSALLLPFELSALSDENSAVLAELIGLLRRNRHFGSILVSDPFKQAVVPLVDEITPQTVSCSAINLIYKRGRTLIGDNRDGEAFLTGANSAHSFNFNGKRMFFFGCGGVSSAIAVTLSKALHTIGLTDLNRERTNSLEAIVHELNPSLQIETFDAVSLRNLANFDVFYNGTGLGKGMNANLTMAASPLKMDDILPSNGAAFDANYTPEKPLFLKQLEPLGFSVFNGLSHMLASTAIHLSLVTGSDVTYRSVESIYKKVFAKQ